MAHIKQLKPDFEVQLPDKQLQPVVFNSPHSGSCYSNEFIASSHLSPLSLRKSEDAFVDELFADMPLMGCPLLKANFPRAFLDLNRGPWELDPKMFKDKLPPHVQTATLRIAGGLGTIARNVSEKETIYCDKLSFSEAEARINRFYFPYHQALQDLIKQTRENFGQALLIDCHSMPSSASKRFSKKNKRPDIILGDRYGAACDDKYIDILEKLLKNSGFETVRNRPYAGGYITQTYGRPFEEVHVIQVEINRAIYMDEKSITKNENFHQVKNNLTNVFTDFFQIFPLLDKNHSAAAE